MRVATRLTLGLIVVSLLLGCGSEKNQQKPLLFTVGALAISSVTAEMQKGKEGKPGKAAPGKAAAKSSNARAKMEKQGKPVLRANIPALGADRFLSVLESRDGVVIWKTTDGATFALRDGILIQTRGLGPDLMSSNVPTVAQLLENGGTHTREYYFLGSDDQTTRRTYTCKVTVVGKEEIVILGKTHVVTRATEECTRQQSGKVTNEFWIEGGTVRKSNQWASSRVGFISFERVVD